MNFNDHFLFSNISLEALNSIGARGSSDGLRSLFRVAATERLKNPYKHIINGYLPGLVGYLGPAGA